jgi:hypothetical protein
LEQVAAEASGLKRSRGSGYASWEKWKYTKLLVAGDVIGMDWKRGCNTTLSLRRDLGVG